MNALGKSRVYHEVATAVNQQVVVIARQETRLRLRCSWGRTLNLPLEQRDPADGRVTGDAIAGHSCEGRVGSLGADARPAGEIRAGRWSIGEQIATREDRQQFIGGFLWLVTRQPFREQHVGQVSLAFGTEADEAAQRGETYQVMDGLPGDWKAARAQLLGEFRANQRAVFYEDLGDVIEGFFANDFAQTKLLIASIGSANGALATKCKLGGDILRRDQVQRTAQAPGEHKAAIDFSGAPEVCLRDTHSSGGDRQLSRGPFL